MSFLKEAFRGEILAKIKTKLLKQKKLSLGDFLQKLEQDEKDLFMGFQLEELFDFSALEKEAKAEEKKTESKALVTDEGAYKGKILSFLKEGGLGIGEKDRGFSTSEIVEVCGGDNAMARKTLNLLQEEKLVDSTGKTKSLRWVIKELHKQAQERYLKE
jgi:hypothetical protein